MNSALKTWTAEEDRALLDLARNPSRHTPYAKLTAPRMNALKRLTKRRVPLVYFTCLPEVAFKLTEAGKLAALALRKGN